MAQGKSELTTSIHKLPHEKRRRWRKIGFAAAGFFILLLAPPHFLDAYVMGILINIAIFAIAALGLNIIVGYCGLLNLGFAGFMCIGAYTAGVLMKAYGWSYWTAMLAATAHGALWGILLGAPTLRLTGDYFAIVTFGFSELVILVAKNWQSLTGGTSGYPDVPRPSVDFSFLQKFGLFSSRSAESLQLHFSGLGKADYWYVVLALVAATILVMFRLSRSRLGRAWRALREDEVAAEACGVNVMWMKTLAFAISAAFGALAGSFQATYLANVNYKNFQFLVSVYILCYLVLGGMGSIWGTVMGTAILLALLDILRVVLGHLGWSPDFRILAYGIILVLMIRFRPEGLVPSRRVRRELHPETQRVLEQANTDYYHFRRG